MKHSFYQIVFNTVSHILCHKWLFFCTQCLLKVAVSRDCLAFYISVIQSFWVTDKQVKMVSLKIRFRGDSQNQCGVKFKKWNIEEKHVDFSKNPKQFCQDQFVLCRPLLALIRIFFIHIYMRTILIKPNVFVSYLKG